MPVVVLEGLLIVSLGLSTSERAKENRKMAALKRRIFSVPSGDVAIFSHCALVLGIALHQKWAECMNSAYLIDGSSARWKSVSAGTRSFCFPI